MGYDLKAGYLLRGYRADPTFERDGRRQQLFAAMFAFVVAGLVVAFANQFYFANKLVAPIDKVYAAPINAGASAEVTKWLFIWAPPGALLQLICGPTHSACNRPPARRATRRMGRPCRHRPALPRGALRAQKKASAT